MSQGSIQPSGAQSKALFSQAWRDAIMHVITGLAGPTAPSGFNFPFAFCPWNDLTAGLVKIRNTADSAWVSQGKLDGFMANGLCQGLSVRVLPTDLTKVVIAVGDSTVEGTYLPPLSSGEVDTNTTVGTINALDTGSWASNTWYAIWAVCAPDASLRGYIASLSGTSPTLPTGYTRKRFLTWVRTSGTATNLLEGTFINGMWTYTGDTTLLLNAGSATSATNVDLSSRVPPGVVEAWVQWQLDSDASLSPATQVRSVEWQANIGSPGFVPVGRVQGPTDSSAVVDWCTVDGNRVVKYRVSGANVTANAFVRGWKLAA